MQTYAILNDDIHHNGSLTAGARLLYADLKNLSKQKGFCWATNNYLSSLYHRSARSIQRWIKALEKEGWISVEVKQHYNREIKITMREEPMKDKREQKCRGGGYDKNVTGGYDKNVTTIVKGDYSKETTDREKEPAAVFSCLNDIDIPLEEKKWISEHYQESVISNAVNWALHKSTKIKKSLAAALKWGCQVGIKAEDAIVDENATYEEAKKLEAKVVKGLSYLYANSKGVEIGFHTSSSVLPRVILYTSKNYTKELKDAINRFGVHLDSFKSLTKRDKV